MGQKDFQQCAIVGRMIEALSLDIELYVCPIVRDNSGLALSSRNVRLSPQGKEQALILSKSLQEAKVTLEKESVQSIVDTVKTQFSESTAELEYFEIVDGRSLQPVADEKDTDFIVACIAAWVDGVRLIDNMILKGGF
jgi:pantoate--beta-alanine ligase